MHQVQYKSETWDRPMRKAYNLPTEKETQTQMKPPIPHLTPAIVIASALITLGAIIGAVVTKVILTRAIAVESWRP
jgi:hypothetical protein